MFTVRFINNMGSSTTIQDLKYATRAEAVHAARSGNWRPGPRLKVETGNIVRTAFPRS